MPTPENNDQRLHAALRSLPTLAAPNALRSRILTAVAERSARWYLRPTWSWPAPARAALALGLAALAAPVAWKAGLAVGDIPGPLSALADGLAALAGAGATAVRAVKLPLLAAAFAAFGMSAAIGTALTQLAPKHGSKEI